MHKVGPLSLAIALTLAHGVPAPLTATAQGGYQYGKDIVGCAAYDTDSGAAAWSLHPGGVIAVGLGAGDVYVLQAGGDLLRADAQTGRILNRSRWGVWTTNSLNLVTWTAGSAPVLTGLNAGTEPRVGIAYERTEPRKQWGRFPMFAVVNGASGEVLAEHEGRALIAHAGLFIRGKDAVRAVDPLTGRTRWSLGMPDAKLRAVPGGDLLAGNVQRLIRVRGDTSDIRWEVSVSPTAPWNGIREWRDVIAVRHRCLVVGAWTAADPKKADIYGQPVVAAIDLESGALLWVHGMHSAIPSPVADADEDLCAGPRTAADARLVAHDGGILFFDRQDMMEYPLCKGRGRTVATDIMFCLPANGGGHFVSTDQAVERRDADGKSVWRRSDLDLGEDGRARQQWSDPGFERWVQISEWGPRKPAWFGHLGNSDAQWLFHPTVERDGRLYGSYRHVKFALVPRRVSHQVDSGFPPVEVDVKVPEVVSLEYGVLAVDSRTGQELARARDVEIPDCNMSVASVHGPFALDYVMPRHLLDRGWLPVRHKDGTYGLLNLARLTPPWEGPGLRLHSPDIQRIADADYLLGRCLVKLDLEGGRIVWRTPLAPLGQAWPRAESVGVIGNRIIAATSFQLPGVTPAGR